MGHSHKGQKGNTDGSNRGVVAMGDEGGVHDAQTKAQQGNWGGGGHRGGHL